MKLKTCLLGQSLVCLGMIASHTEVATAEVNELPTAESVTQTCCTIDNFEPFEPSLTAVQTLSPIAGSRNTAIAPPERNLQVISHKTAELSPIQSQNSCSSTKVLAGSISTQKVNEVLATNTSVAATFCSGTQTRWMSLASPEMTVERGIQAQVSRVSSIHKDFSTLAGLSLSEVRSPESLEQLPLSPSITDDPELGGLQVAESSVDPELGRLRLWEQPSGDPELGRLRLQEQPLLEDTQEEAEDTVFLLGRVSFFSSDNILLDAFDPVDDQVFQGGLGLFASPQIGPDTYLFGGISRSLSVYNNLSGLNYSDLELQAGIRQVIFSNTYVDASWTNQQFFGLDSSGRFFTDNSLRLSLSHREQLSDRLFLDGYYQFRFSFTDPSDRSRIFNNIGLSIGYDLAPDLEAGLGYQLILSDFTQEERHDSYHEVTAQLSYDFSENARVTMFGGFSFGDSTESSLDFDSSLFGVIFSTNFSLF